MLKARILLGLFLIVGAFSSCKKELSPEKQAAKDDALIVEFIAKNSIVAVKHSSGVYYQVISDGSGARPTLANEVTVGYTGKLLNGNVFDKSNPTATFALNRLIVGWQIGVPLIKKGGSIRLIVPSGLAYGSSSPGLGIPKNAVLDFTIDLIDVK
ncbi:MAG: FKBP-type peptidyl-prolyl cis-trans isomerase [Sphingobacteriaceae bacterium]|nr:FKBP-type peptidyl-prolyl cis-trans isomerase [Sphingobacteriaceae bacterium]